MSVPQRLIAFVVLACGLASGCTRPGAAGVAPDRDDAVAIRSIALRVYDLDAMAAFYSEAFGVTFREVDTFGVTSRFGDLAGVTLKLVPIRESRDLEGYPDLQMGVVVDDIDRVVRVALTHGGREEGERRREAGVEHGAVRDPDGNTLELYRHFDADGR